VPPPGAVRYSARDGRQSTSDGRPLPLTIRRATSGVAKPVGDLGDLSRAPPQDFLVALSNEPAACRAGYGMSVSLEPCLVSVEFIMAMRADEMQGCGGLIRCRPYSWHWLTPKAALCRRARGDLSPRFADRGDFTAA
jgi:hypothetical protein